MKHFKVLQINKLYYPWIGGIEKVVQNIAEDLKSEVDMAVLVCRNWGKGRNETINSVKVMRAGSLGIFFSMPLSLSFPIMLKRLNRDILHFHLPFPLAVASYFLMRPKGRVVVTYHSDIIRQRLFKVFYRPFLMKFLKRADCIITASPNLRDNSPILTSISNNEAFGIVQLEAFTCGKPVISTNLPTGVPFVNLHEKTGLIVPSRDSRALARAINRLLKSPDLCRKYGQYARERMEKEFTKELMAQRVLKLYQNLTS